MNRTLTLDDVSATVKMADRFLVEHMRNAPWHWVDQTAAARYADVLRYCGRHVRLIDGWIEVNVPRTSDGVLWGYAASEILDAAMAARHDGEGLIVSTARGYRFTL